MYDEEADQKQHRGEMDGAGGLASAQHVGEERDHRVHRRRHGEPGQDHQRQQDEQHAAIGEFLQRVVVPLMVEFQLRMVGDVAGEAAEVVDPRGEVAPEVAVDEAGDQPDQQRAGKYPGEEEMHDAAGRQVLSGRDGRPGRKAAPDRAFRTARHAEDAGCVEARAKQADIADRTLRRVFAAHGEDLVVEAEARLLADIERRMRVEYLQAGQQQEEQADGPDPVR